MKNEPKKIWLNIGHDIDKEECDELDFNDTDEVTWSCHEIYENDINYVNMSLIVEFIRANPKATAGQIIQFIETE